MSRIPPPIINFTVRAEATLGRIQIDVGELKRCLRAVADTQSITHAARALGVTYRTLWGRLQTYDDSLHAKLVGKSRGRGTSLTGKGRALLAALDRHADLFTPPAAERIRALEIDLSRAMGEQPLLRLLASHDYAIVRAFAQGEVASTTPTLGSVIHSASAGSDDCVRALLRGEADLAGYHHATTETKTASTAPWARVERSDDFWSVALMKREQGLIISPRSKTRVKSLGDLTGSGVRFVNRQRGSGTRTLLDALLEDARISPAKISGYEQEEFTHQAVAATIAAGAADAGLGLRAAAAQFKLHFIPLATETYRLTGRNESQTHPAVIRLIASIREAASTLPGYEALH